MRYLSVTEIAKKWDVSERSVRNYCAQGRVNDAFLTGKTWNIPENAEKPERINKRKEEVVEGTITIGCSEFAAVETLAKICKTYKEKYPLVQINS